MTFSINDFSKTSKIVNVSPNAYTKIKFEKSLEKFVNKANEYKESGELIKAEFDSVKDNANRVVEESWSALRALFRSRFLDHSKVTPEFEYIDYQINSTYANNVPSILKKMSNNKNIDQTNPDVILANDILKELLPLSEAVRELKTKIVKKRRATVEKEQKKSDLQKSIMSHKDVILCKNFVNDFMSDIRTDLELSQNKYYQSIADKIISENPEGTTKWDMHKKYAMNPFMRGIADGLTKSTGSYSRRSLVEFNESNVIELFILKKAKTDISSLIDFFVNRVTEKIAPVLADKGNLDTLNRGTYNIRNGIIEADLCFRFKDKSTFKLKSAVEYAMSKNNNLFLRFPSRFADVFLQNGEKMPFPSEENMHKVFMKIKKEPIKEKNSRLRKP
jgi:hypothetical protein